jgi:isopropylmalate/homocitrate/citramalate synthase
VGGVVTAYGDGWFVSWHNLDGEEPPAEPFVVHDTTLRDGEQQAGVLFSLEEKVEIAHALDGLGVDRIEAGMVAVSEDDREAIRRLAGAGLRAEVWTIVRSLEADVEQAIDCGVAGAGVILLANEQYCEIFGWTAESALEQAVATAARARDAGLATTLLVADSPRMARERLVGIVAGADAAGVFDALALMDTFGTLSPEGTRRLLATARGASSLPLELHPHNDFGLATANALAGLEAGASVIHTSVLGLGERVGNTPLEELALAAPLLYGRRHNLDLARLHDTAALVQARSRVRVAPNKPVVGESYRQIESGTVAAEFARWSARGKDLQWLFPFVPSLVGAPGVELVLGKGSGLANLDAALAEAGVELDEDAKRELLARAKATAIERHRLLTKAELLELARA